MRCLDVVYTNVGEAAGKGYGNDRKSGFMQG